MRTFILFISIFIVSTLASSLNHPVTDGFEGYGFPFVFLIYFSDTYEDMSREWTDIDILNMGLDMIFSLILALMVNLGVKKFRKNSTA